MCLTSSTTASCPRRRPAEQGVLSQDVRLALHARHLLSGTCRMLEPKRWPDTYTKGDSHRLLDEFRLSSRASWLVLIGK